MNGLGPQTRQERRRARAPRRAASIVALVLLGGPVAEGGAIADWFAAAKAPAPDTTTPDRELRTQGRLMDRWMTRDKSPFTTESLDSSSALVGERGWEKTRVAPDPVSEAEFAAAKKSFDAKDYRKAEPLFAALAKREVRKGTPWGARAQYFLAETQFQRKDYNAALESYQWLLKKYPGESENRDKVIARGYEIAMIWLADDDPKAKPTPMMARFDGRAPLLDRKGYAVKALEWVRLHDPNGPLADHAALRTADHYHAVGDYEQAAVFYDQLLTEHAKSPLRERAMLSSIDAKIKGYVGPEYDGTGLDSAKETIQRAIAEFPERQAGNEELYHTLDLINDQHAEREYTHGLYYVRSRKPISAEYQFGLVIAKWPKSKWAELARVELKKTAKMPRKASVPSRIMTQPGAPDPNSMGGNGGGSGGGGMGGMGGMGGAGSGMGAPF